MMGTMIRKWMEMQGHSRDEYFVLGLMPCVAKKEEITRPELRNKDGTQDVDCILTVREFARLMKRRQIDWASLPGSFSGEYDAPFGKCSGGGALFGASGGVAEAALRVAYSLFSKESVPNDPQRKIYGAVRKYTKPGEWIEANVNITPDKSAKRPLETVVVSGGRAIQKFLEDTGLDTEMGECKFKGAKVFVECMACPGGCIGGGGQPQSLDPDAIAKRREAIHTADVRSEKVSANETVGKLDYKALFGVSRRKMGRLLTYEPPKPIVTPCISPHPEGNEDSKSVASGAGDQGITVLHRRTGSSISTETPTSSLRSGNATANVAVLYGSQAGFTATRAKEFRNKLHHALGEHISFHSLDSFPFELIEQTKVVIILTSTWESDMGLMPSNARKFWKTLSSLPLESTGDFFLGTCFAVCGFGSTKYKQFCGFATQIHEVFTRFGAYPIMDVKKIDVDTSDLYY